MNNKVIIDESIEIAVKLDETEGTSLDKLISKSLANQKIHEVEYTVLPGENTSVTFPFVSIEVLFPMNEVSKIMMPQDFNAQARIGMWLDGLDVSSSPISYEPFVAYTNSAGRCLCLIGLSNLELECRLTVTSYGGGDRPLPASKQSSFLQIKRNSFQEGHYKGNVPKEFNDKIYIDCFGGNCLEAVGRYFSWLKQRYNQYIDVPDWADEMHWSTWYACNQFIDQKIVGEQADIAAKLGIRRIQIDAGWNTAEYADCEGSYRPETDRFPDFKGLIDKIHNNGQKVGLHWAPFWVWPKCEKRDDLKKYLIIPEKEEKRSAGGNPGFEAADDSSRILLCPRCKETREHIISSAAGMVREYDADELWFDFIDHPNLLRECKADHEHLAGTPTENLLDILRSVVVEVRKIKPDVTFVYRRAECNVVTKQYLTHLWPWDRPHDYLGNLRECLYLREISDKELVNFCDTCWPCSEKPEVVARHMIASIFAGIPAISVDLTEQTEENLSVIKVYGELYHRNRVWLKYARRIVICPEDTIRAIGVFSSKCYWILGTGTLPGRICIPDSVDEVKIFVSSADQVDICIETEGQWTGVNQNFLLEDVHSVRLEKIEEGFFVSEKGMPLFCLKLTRNRQV